MKTHLHFLVKSVSLEIVLFNKYLMLVEFTNSKKKFLSFLINF